MGFKTFGLGNVCLREIMLPPKQDDGYIPAKSNSYTIVSLFFSPFLFVLFIVSTIPSRICSVFLAPLSLLNGLSY